MIVCRCKQPTCSWCLSLEQGCLAKELEMFRDDLKQAAGELLVPCPEPGTDMSRILIANRILKYELANALKLVEKLKRELCSR